VVVHPFEGLSLPIIELGDEAEITNTIERHAVRPFNLAEDALLRVLLIRKGRREHLLLVNMHHMIADGWSVDVLLGELAAFYRSFSDKQASPLPELDVQYGDFARWHRALLASDALASQKAYWQEQLEGAATFLEMPTDWPRPKIRDARGALARFEIQPALSEALQRACQAHSVTPFQFLQAVFAVLLHRYARQDDVLVGTPIANRNHTVLEPLIGFLANTLVLRNRMTGDPTFAEFLATVRQTTLDAYANQDLPFDQVVELVQPERDTRTTPLFQVMFSMQHTAEALDLPGLRSELIEIGPGTSRFDLALAIQPEAQGWRGTWEYATALFGEATIQRMTTHLLNLIEAALVHPEKRLSQLEMVGEAEQLRLTHEWNQNETARELDLCLHQLIERQVTKTPNSLAVRDGEIELDFAQLNARANRLAHYLRDLGLRPEQPVAVLMRRSASMVTGLLALLKAGAAYIPLDAQLPTRRLGRILNDGALVLTTSDLTERVPEGVTAIALDGLDDVLETMPDHNPEPRTAPGHLAYVIFTSGSTGVPKGISITHRNLTHYVSWSAERYGIAEGEGSPIHGSIAFDATNGGLWAPLLVGKPVTMVPDGGELEQLVHHLAKPSPYSAVRFTPAHLEALPGLAPDDAVWDMKRLIVGGEALYGDRLAYWRKAIPNAVLVNEYGPSETTVGCCIHECAMGEVPDGPIPIGSAIADMRLYVIEPGGVLAPVGVPGELLIGGLGVGRGYFANPALTAQRFLPDPFSDLAGERLYRSGDLVKRLADGALQFLGRVDHQVKLRGYRIELGDIEAVLTASELVREAAVILTEDQLVGFFVPSHPQASAEAQLFANLAAELPDYMVPSALIRLDVMPLNTNGKVDRAALAAMDIKTTRLAGTYLPPETPVEQFLAQTFAELLDVVKVGREDHFFKLGGHSLLATQLVSRIRSAFEIELPLRAIFANPRLAGLADAIESQMGQDRGDILPPVSQRPDLEAIPLTPGQERLWFLFQLEGPHPRYNLPIGMRLRGNLNRDALIGGLNEVMRRHQVLRMNFVESEGLPRAVIAEGRTFPIEDRDASHLDAAALAEIVAEEAARPFDLGEDSLLRGRLLVLGPDDYLLLITMHHIVADGWSMNILIREWAEAYSAILEDRRPRLEPLVLQVPDVAHWQRGVLGSQLEAERAYWQRQLAGAPTFLPLPTDRPRPRVQSGEGSLLPLRLSSDLVDAVDRFAEARNATRFMVLEAAFAVLLQRYSGQTDFLVGFPVAGRNRGELEPLIGFFVNTLVLRNRVEPRENFISLVDAVKRDTLEAQNHQSLPFESVVDMVQPERAADHSPLFQVMFILQNLPRRSLQLPGLKIEICPREDKVAHFDLTLCLEEFAGGIEGYFEYNVALFDRATIEAMANRFLVLLQGLLEHPTLPAGAQSLMSDQALKRLQKGWRGPQLEQISSLGYHHLFEVQAARRPKSTALVWGRDGETLTYEELHLRAERLMQVLVRAGVRQGDLVAVCLNRHAGLIVSLLAIQKTGAAYVPLDPKYPTDRVRLILEDAQPAVIVTQPEYKDLVRDSEAIRLEVEPDGSCRDGHYVNGAVKPVSGLLSHLIYTSGSTGKPKGVAVTRTGVACLIEWSKAWYADDALDGVLAATSICFDLSVFEIMVTLCRGGKVVLVENVLDLVEHPAANQVQLINTVPSAVTELLNLKAIPESVNCINLAGEPLHRSLADELYAQPQVKRVINLYGPSEDTTYSTVALVPRHESSDPLIGTPIANTKALVLDPLGMPVPVGLVGELHLAGDGLACGYHRRPGLTASSFVPDPFATVPGGRMYRTGDLVRAMPGDETPPLAFLGRRDRQIKLRGFRIELDEIEAALTEHTLCREAAVVVNAKYPDRLIAHVATPADQSVDVGDILRRYLTKVLPVHMVPSHILATPKLPHLPNGKIDRKLLSRMPLPRSAVSSESLVLSRNEIEARIAAIWEEVLGRDEIGVHDNFFDLGGHSLLATRIIAQVRDQMGAKLPLNRLFDDPTVAGLAKLVETVHWAANEPVQVGASDDFENGEI